MWLFRSQSATTSLTTGGVCRCTGEVVWKKRQLLSAGGSVSVTQPVSLTAAAAKKKRKVILPEV